MGIISFIKKVCAQTAVYWGNPVADGTGGYTFDAAREISCRWDDRGELFKDDKGNTIRSRAKVLIPQSDAVQDEGWLFLGDLDDSGLDSDSNPMEVEGAYQIKRIDRTPLFKSSTDFVITAYLTAGGQV